MRVGILMIAAGLSTAVLAQAAPDLRPPVVVGESSGPVRLEPGRLLEVRLPMQAGTGYSWAASAEGASLEFIEQVTLHPWGAAPTVGGSQTQMFIYRAVAPGEAVLRFAYRRPWEGGVPPAKTVETVVSVRR